MPIEIKELHIKINVDDKAQSTVSDPPADRRQIIRAISDGIEQAVSIEQRKKER